MLTYRNGKPDRDLLHGRATSIGNETTGILRKRHIDAIRISSDSSKAFVIRLGDARGFAGLTTMGKGERHDERLT